MNDIMTNLQDYRLHVHSVASKLGCSTRTVYRLIETGELKAIRKTPRNTRISESSFVEYANKRLTEATAIPCI